MKRFVYDENKSHAGRISCSPEDLYRDNISDPSLTVTVTNRPE